jgi:hypothetical protein
MAKLQKLEEFDKNLAQCIASLRKVTSQITPISPQPDHVQQAEQQEEILNALISLTRAVTSLVHHNR